MVIIARACLEIMHWIIGGWRQAKKDAIKVFYCLNKAVKTPENKP
jgi:hypothetical protein